MIKTIKIENKPYITMKTLEKILKPLIEDREVTTKEFAYIALRLNPINKQKDWQVKK